MAHTLSTTEPAVITAGDTATWKKTLADYPAGDGWVLSYTLISSAGKIAISASADGDDHLVSVAPATTDDWAAGKYQWQAYVALAGARYTVGTGTVEIKKNFADAALTTYDGRSHARIALEAIEAMIQGRASVAHQEMEIAGRRVKYIPIPELLALRDTYRREVIGEENADRINRGLAPKNRILVRL